MIKNLGFVLDSSEFKKYLDEAKKLSIVYHKYGGKISIPDHPCWMSYQMKSKTAGSIAFTRNTLDNLLLAEMVEKIIKVLDSITIDTFKPRSDRVHLMRTVGSIPPHCDEANRKCCINIGLLNSSSAVINTNFICNSQSTDTEKINFTLLDGHACLLDTSKLHSVTGNLTVERYLITYGFGSPYDEISTLFR